MLDNPAHGIAGLVRQGPATLPGRMNGAELFPPGQRNACPRLMSVNPPGSSGGENVQTPGVRGQFVQKERIEFFRIPKGFRHGAQGWRGAPTLGTRRWTDQP